MTPMLETWFYERLLWEMTILNVKGKKNTVQMTQCKTRKISSVWQKFVMPGTPSPHGL